MALVKPWLHPLKFCQKRCFTHPVGPYTWMHSLYAMLDRALVLPPSCNCTYCLAGQLQLLLAFQAAISCKAAHQPHPVIDATGHDQLAGLQLDAFCQEEADPAAHVTNRPALKCGHSSRQ